MGGELAFSLDIGTRKVVGLVTQPTARGLRIVAAEKMEHRSRAMFDGQIHDVVEVSSVVAAIRERLEARCRTRLEEVAVAAAGRALRTFRGIAVRTGRGDGPFTRAEVRTLELEAVQDAQRALAEGLRDEGEARNYLYVGHSVLGWELDSVPLTRLEGQRGQVARVEVIATFLPRGVLDSLLAVLERVGLTMTALTLEPIAAIGVVVPPTMRHLNLVLVDIGAGTSDIAVTQGGTVVAYDMVPVAGDEITEALSEHYLLDFTVAEAVKRQINRGQPVRFQDVLGVTHEVPAAELAAALRPAVESLARRLAERILRLNGRAPQAVVLVGGGSQTPGLAEAVAAELGLPPARVAVRGRDAIQGVTGAKALLGGPDAVTPIGIAVAAREETALGVAYVYVNGAGVRLYHPSRLTVADALLAAGYSMRDLQPRLGPGLTVRVNGELKLVPGTAGRPARIEVNGAAAGLDSPVRHGDRITVKPAAPGQPGRARVRDVLPDHPPLAVTVNGEERRIEPLVLVSGRPASLDEELRDNDDVVARLPATLGEVLAALGLVGADEAVTLRYRVALPGGPAEGVEHVLRRPRFRLAVDGLPADPATPVSGGSRIDVTPLPPPTVGEAVTSAGIADRPLRVRVNGRPLALPVPLEIRRDGNPVRPEEPLHDGDVLVVQPGGSSLMLAHVLEHVDMASSPPSGQSRLVLTVSGRPADFATPIRDGDDIVIAWE
ncbi:cell division FtsA domain-containing protein [Caldinitratiruptor microaerophilus]|uniref:Cell division protein FtsA n=1 Tax=Caldinitratiruptor microaerophilus TaxID=671077 RepID=A0AA35CMJ0_9FIRM|nr:cell division FtsA domain-containing protein [Caldinitratiruptor microaerophilus]BDG60040.1 cell division protein FtsA [Caldinitratiruptor microaerophilus]